MSVADPAVFCTRTDPEDKEWEGRTYEDGRRNEERTYDSKRRKLARREAKIRVEEDAKAVEERRRYKTDGGRAGERPRAKERKSTHKTAFLFTL